jgi:cytochrome c-type biogenesis protein CcmH
MTAFVVLAMLMTVAALGLVAWPLFRARASDGRSALIAVAVLAVLVPGTAVLLYRTVSNWDWDPAAIAAAYSGKQSLEDLAAKVEDRVRRKPDDLEAWLLLGRTRFVMKDLPRALEAFASAYRVSNGQNLQAVIGYGETMAMADQSTVAGKAGELFEQAMKLDPSNPKALFYGGAAAAATGHLDVARDRWATLLKQPLPDEVRVAVALRVGQLDEQLGRTPDPEIAKLATVAPEAAAAASQPEAASGPGAATVHVSVSPALAARIPAGTPLFVLARDPTQPGPPFAAKRLPATPLPATVVLGEQDAMMPGRTLKAAHQLVIVARYSASGRPTASSGDWYGEVPYDLAAGKTTELVIDKQVP